MLRTMHQELQREYRLARARATHQQRRATAWRASTGDFIEPTMPVAALAGALPTAERADFICFPEEARSLSRRWTLTNASVLGRCAAWDSMTAPFAIAPDLRGGAKIAVARSLYPFTVAFALKANQARRAAVDGAAATRATAPDVECARRSRIRS